MASSWLGVTGGAWRRRLLPRRLSGNGGGRRRQRRTQPMPFGRGLERGGDAQRAWLVATAGGDLKPDREAPRRGPPPPRAPPPGPPGEGVRAPRAGPAPTG